MQDTGDVLRLQMGLVEIYLQYVFDPSMIPLVSASSCIESICFLSI